MLQLLHVLAADVEHPRDLRSEHRRRLVDLAGRIRVERWNSRRRLHASGFGYRQEQLGVVQVIRRLAHLEVEVAVQVLLPAVGHRRRRIDVHARPVEALAAYEIHELAVQAELQMTAEEAVGGEQLHLR